MCKLQVDSRDAYVLTCRLTKRYIIRSVRCRIGVAVSPDAMVEVCEVWAGLGAVATPLEEGGFDDRWVMGLVPWVHALAGGFL